MAEPATLLPPNSTPMMVGLSEAFAEALALPEVSLGDLWDPWKAPAGRLPSLAADLGVLLWKPEWPDSKKRRVIARTIDLKRRRGTRRCFETHLEFVGATLEALHNAPQITTARTSKSAADRASWAAQFPELRIYAYRQRHPGRGLVAGGCWGGTRRAPRVSQAAVFSGRRATMVRDGVETTVALRVEAGATEFTQAHLVAALPERGRRLFVGACLHRRSAKGSTASERFYRFRAGDRQLDLLPPGPAALDVQPTRVTSAATRPAGMVAGGSLVGGRRFLRQSTASQRVYDSFRLFDPALARSTRIRTRGGWFAGRSRLGQPPFELRLDINVTRKAPGRSTFPFRWNGVVRPHDGAPTADALAAVRAAKLGRDRVLVRTNLHRPLTAGDEIPLDGSFRLGQIVRSF